MWFLTDNGIDRYDGTEMGTYTLTFDKTKNHGCKVVIK